MAREHSKESTCGRCRGRDGGPCRNQHPCPSADCAPGLCRCCGAAPFRWASLLTGHDCQLPLRRLLAAVRPQLAKSLALGGAVCGVACCFAFCCASKTRLRRLNFVSLSCRVSKCDTCIEAVTHVNCTAICGDIRTATPTAVGTCHPRGATHPGVSAGLLVRSTRPAAPAGHWQVRRELEPHALDARREGVACLRSGR